MLDRVPFRSTRRVVAHRNGEAVGSGNGLVETVFPKAWSVAIAASAVTEQQDFLHAGIGGPAEFRDPSVQAVQDRKSTRLNSSHVEISYAVFCLKKKNKDEINVPPGICHAKRSITGCRCA